MRKSFSKAKRSETNPRYLKSLAGSLLLLIAILGGGYYIYQNYGKSMLGGKVAVQTTQSQTKSVESVEAPAAKVETVEKQTFGYSTAGKPITGYVFGTGTETTLMFGSIHGNEMGTANLLNTLVKYIQNNPSSVASSQRVVIIPILNPDGYFDRTDKLNANGVNLNLNFGTSDWAMYGSEGQYAGPAAWSEVESRILRTVVEEYLPTRMISYHSNGSLSNPESAEVSQELAWWYAVESGYYYFADPSWDYSGTATKWFEETYKKAAITVELNDHYMNDWNMNKKPMLELLSGSSGLL